MMLTRSTPTGSRFQVPVTDLDAFARSAGDLATHELPELIRRADLPRRLEDRADALADAVHAAAGQVPGLHPRSTWQRTSPVLVIAGVGALIGTAFWLLKRSSAMATAHEIERELHEDALESTVSEVMAGGGADRPATHPR